MTTCATTIFPIRNLFQEFGVQKFRLTITILLPFPHLEIVKYSNDNSK